MEAILTIVKRLLCRHENKFVTYRMIEVDQKKNKPPELLYEMKEYCCLCSRETKRAYSEERANEHH